MHVGDTILRDFKTVKHAAKWRSANDCQRLKIPDRNEFRGFLSGLWARLPLRPVVRFRSLFLTNTSLYATFYHPSQQPLGEYLKYAHIKDHTLLYPRSSNGMFYKRHMAIQPIPLLTIDIASFTAPFLSSRYFFYIALEIAPLSSSVEFSGRDGRTKSS